MYRIGDKVAHPMHGAGVIDSVVQRTINGVSEDYFLLNLSQSGMSVMIPTKGTVGIGMRPVVSSAQAAGVVSAMGEMHIDPEQNWNRRYRDNMEKLKSGDLLEVARVVKGLMLRERERPLSTGERKMLQTARQILISELVLAQDLSYETVSDSIARMLA